MNLALIVAAGKGTRMGKEGGKQFLPLAGKPVLAHTLISFQQASSIDAIVVVVAEENFEKCLSVIDKHDVMKVDRVVIGGDERQDSVYNGLQAAMEFGQINLMAIHDGARPLIKPELIDEAVAVLDDCDGAVVGIPAKDTIKLVHEGYIIETLNRASTWQIQTPQVFRFETLLYAHERAKSEGYYGTDDAVLVERNGGRIKVVLGSDENIKITTPSDLAIAEAILEARNVGLE